MNNGAFEEMEWLSENPAFWMRPANIREFVGPGYLNERNVRPGIMQALVETFGEKVNPYSLSPKRKAVITGAIGIGKSTYAAIALCYMVHWVKCLKNPKEFYNLSEDSIIGFMMMSTTEKLAREVIFQKVKRRIEKSQWFKDHTEIENQKLERQMRFVGDIWIVPGSSEETSFEGYDILGGIVDEGDSHKVTERKNYAMAGYTTIESRIKSRFTDFKAKNHRGLIICIGQSKSKSGFMMTKYREFEKDPDGVALRLSLWESYGWYNYTKDPNDVDRGIETAERDSFYYDMRKRLLLEKETALLVMNNNLIEVPNTYRSDFEADPVKALRDLGGIPPEIEDPFISQVDKILKAQEKWHERVGVQESPAGHGNSLDKIELPDWFRPIGISSDFRRVIHIDTAYSPDGDALGFAMGHVPEKIFQHEEERPVVVYDLLLRLQATASQEINFGRVREFIYKLRDTYGFDIDMVTVDGFNSMDFIQQLRRNKIKADYLSVDKNKAPYEDLRDIIHEGRTEFPFYMVPYARTDTALTNIAYKELSEVRDVGRKIDHPVDGSKDVADGMAGVAHVLISNTKYMREARTVEPDDDSPRERVVENVEELFSSFDVESATLEEAASFKPVSFEDFKRTETGLPSMEDLSRLMNGDGTPGFPMGERLL
ncbi:terminase [Gordonia phage Kvothe]|uniref:Terminase n=1 Tax=Gordonia phage Kvothe TaxID=1838071 RepID=A0A160DE59_9CAUD|nr:terminase [Gordonia phage Kvothe]ANA86075.1 terminase [Gordonia phage Kvothe]